jgi:anti-sigma-K factor RskA
MVASQPVDAEGLHGDGVMSDELDMQAGEYVLGTLDATERAAFAARLEHDDAARRAVALWATRLTPLGNVVDAVEVPANVWPRIEAGLGSTRPALQLLQGGVETEKLVSKVVFWRRTAVLSGALAAGLALFVASSALLNPPVVPQKNLVAVVNRGGDQPALIVRVDLASGQVFVRPVSTEVPQGRSLELWYIGDGAAPKSMGLVNKEALRLPVPAGAKMEKVTFAVTVEPVGGSPTGGPTGPIVYSGQLIQE